MAKNSKSKTSTYEAYEKELGEIDDMMQFIDENANDVKEAFCVFDKQCTGRIPTSKLGTILRTLGMNPTEDALIRMEGEVDGDRNGVIDFIEFLKLMKKTWEQVDLVIFFVSLFGYIKQQAPPDSNY